MADAAAARPGDVLFILGEILKRLRLSRRRWRGVKDHTFNQRLRAAASKRGEGDTAGPEFYSSGTLDPRLLLADVKTLLLEETRTSQQ